MLPPADLEALWLTLRLAAWVTGLLLILCTPLAWALARSRGRLAMGVEALASLPLVLPPTVLGFYLLLMLGPRGPVGELFLGLGLDPPAFTFHGLVLGSLVYSLPFVLHPLRTAFQSIGPLPLEAAATLRAGPLDRLWSVVLPLSRNGFLTAAVMGFAHTLGEFGVVLMIGGNIPGRTRVAAIAIFDHAEALRTADAHRLSAVMVGLSFLLLLGVQGLNRHRDSPLP